MPSVVNLTYKDYDGESSVFTVPIGDVNDTNLEATITALGNLVTAVSGICNGALRKREIVSSLIDTAASPPGTSWAQRERKWLLRFRPLIGGESDYTLEVPTADLSLLDPAIGRRHRMIVGTEYAALSAAIDAFLVSPEGSDLYLFQAVHVGRNL